MSEHDVLDEDLDLIEASDDDTDLVRTLRARLKDASKRAKGKEKVDAENRTLKAERVIDKAGLTDLTDRQRAALLREVGDDEATPETLREIAVEFGWAEAAPDPVQDEIDEHDQIAAAGNGARPKGGQQITPDEFSGWDPIRMRQFRNDHPAEFEQLKRGESVTSVAA